MLKSRQAKVMALAGLMGVAGLMAGCPGPTDPTPQPKTCDCPNGTIHLTGESCCEGIDCTCETGVVGERLECGILVTKRGEISSVNMDKIVSNINTAYVTFFELAEESEKEIFVNSIKEMRIVASGVENINEFKNGKYVITVSEDSTVSQIQSIFGEIATEVLSQAQHKNKNL